MNLIHKIAYIDPGAGSILFQAFLSGLLTFAIFFKRIVNTVKKIFKNK